jgi:hypothetical protein
LEFFNNQKLQSEQISTEYKKRVLHCHPDKVNNERDKKEGILISILIIFSLYDIDLILTFFKI